MPPPRKLPLLDIHQYYHNPSQFVEELRSAAHKIGFFLLQHDIPHELVQRQLDETRTFFQQPLPKKELIPYHKSASFRGYMYMKLGVENTSGAVDLREQCEYAATYPKSQINDKVWPPYERLKANSNPWPTECQPTLQSTTEAYIPHICRIADCIRQALCLALGADKTILDPIFGSSSNNHHDDEPLKMKLPDPQPQPHWALKLVSYPVVHHDDQKKQTQAQSTTSSSALSFGVGEHTDTNFLTLVLQDDIGGLQVFSDGDWMDVPNNLGPGILVVNLGEQAEILSRGYFLATPHRVLSNVGGKRERISVPFFYNPMLSARIQPIVGGEGLLSSPSQDDDQDGGFGGGATAISSLKWERHGDQRHWRRKDNAMLATVGDNTFKSLARSHPEVFQKHHNDLVLLDDGSVIRKEQ